MEILINVLRFTSHSLFARVIFLIYSIRHNASFPLYEESFFKFHPLTFVIFLVYIYSQETKTDNNSISFDEVSVAGRSTMNPYARDEGHSEKGNSDKYLLSNMPTKPTVTVRPTVRPRPRAATEKSINKFHVRSCLRVNICSNFTFGKYRGVV